MASTTHTDRGRGRPREFDEDAVLDALVELFWEQGFESASLAEIVEVAGLNKSSLYNAFGSKDELFRRVLDRYVTAREQMLERATGNDRGLDALLDLIELLRAEALSKAGRLGCFAINATAELGVTSPEIVTMSQRYRDMMRRHVRCPLARAAELGEIVPDMVDVYVDTLFSFILATALAARGGASADELNHHLDSMQALIESWKNT